MCDCSERPHRTVDGTSVMVVVTLTAAELVGTTTASRILYDANAIMQEGCLVSDTKIKQEGIYHSFHVKKKRAYLYVTENSSVLLLVQLYNIFNNNTKLRQKQKSSVERGEAVFSTNHGRIVQIMYKHKTPKPSIIKIDDSS